jgi:DNA repair protein RecN (Recombination protein N)
MIENLRIENIAIVDRSELEFGPGLNVLTGETGAGKSIVLGALSLLAGGPGRADRLRKGAERGAVEALFRTEQLPDLERELELRDLLAPALDHEGAEGTHELVVRRTLGANGRGRARIGGQLVPAATLGELFGERVEISSQHSSQALLRPLSHGRFLDEAGGLIADRERVRSDFEALRALDSELTLLRGNLEERRRQRDFLVFQLAEIDEVDLKSGELEAVEAEHDRLAHAESLRAEASDALLQLLGDESGGLSRGVGDMLQLVARSLEAMARHDGRLDPLLERVRGADSELRDLAADLERYLDAVEADPLRLAALEERIAQFERLRGKYGRGEAEILARRDELRAELSRAEGADSRIDEIEAERAEKIAALAKAARRLSRGRKRAALQLCEEVEQSLGSLGMPDARFEVGLEASPAASSWPEGAPCGPGGSESPEFRFGANPGEPTRPLRKVASGGELSRIFLALKNALRRSGAGMVLVFDEVDAGIGGRTAERVGRALADLAERHQVLCITHLPQIAVFADRHFRVEKKTSRGRSRAEIAQLDAEGRVEEIARMAGGEAISEGTRQHARELLAAAGAGIGSP